MSIQGDIPNNLLLSLRVFHAVSRSTNILKNHSDRRRLAFYQYSHSGGTEFPWPMSKEETQKFVLRESLSTINLS